MLYFPFLHFALVQLGFPKRTTTNERANYEYDLITLLMGWMAKTALLIFEWKGWDGCLISLNIIVESCFDTYDIGVGCQTADIS